MVKKTTIPDPAAAARADAIRLGYAHMPMSGLAYDFAMNNDNTTMTTMRLEIALADPDIQ
jgi:hypothetical protein